MIKQKLIITIAFIALLFIIPVLTNSTTNKAQANFYVALRYITSMESGDIEINKANIKRVIRYTKRALDLKDDHPQSNYLYAHTLLNYYKDKQEQALKHIKKAQASFPQSPLVNIKTALIYISIASKEKESPPYPTPNLEKALLHIKASLEHGKTKEEQIEYSNQLAVVHTKLQNYSKVNKVFESTIKKYPESPNLHNNFAWFLTENHPFYNPQKALVHAKKAIELSSHSKPYILDTLATVYSKLGEYKKAIEIEKEAYKLAKSQKDKALFYNKIKAFEALLQDKLDTIKKTL